MILGGKGKKLRCSEKRWVTWTSCSRQRKSWNENRNDPPCVAPWSSQSPTPPMEGAWIRQQSSEGLCLRMLSSGRMTYPGTVAKWELRLCQLPCEGFLHTRSYQVFSLDQTHHEHYRWVVLFTCGRSQHSGSNWPEGAWCLEVEEPASVSRSNPAASSDSVCASRGFLI